MKIEYVELEKLFAFNVVVGVVNLGLGGLALAITLSWDTIAKHFALQHQQGLGLGQIMVAGFCGLWILLSYGFIQYTLHYWKYYGKT